MTQAAHDTKLLVEGCLRNDRRSQEALYRKYYAFAMALALRYARDESDAADILSLAFVKVFKGLRSYDPAKGELHSWIKQIVIHEALDHIKSRHRFTDHIDLATIEGPDVNNQALEQADAGEIMTMIQKLPPATHAVFVLYAVEGYSHKEIAGMLNISPGTSKWHLSEARKLLQQQLQNRFEQTTTI